MISDALLLQTKGRSDYYYMHGLMIEYNTKARKVCIGQPLGNVGFCELDDADVKRLINFLNVYMNTKAIDESSDELGSGV